MTFLIYFFYNYINIELWIKLALPPGTKHIDPDSGLIYFKYDFGYEFGIIFPGAGRKFIVATNKANKTHLSDRFLHNSAGVIDIPVLHEKTIKKNLLANSNSPVHDIYQLRKNALAAKRQPTVPAIEINVDDFHSNDERGHGHHPMRKGMLN